MGGSGGGFLPKKSSDIDELKSELKRSVDKTQSSQFQTEVNSYLNEILVDYNNRDTGKIEDRLRDIKECISEDIEGSVDVNFGGSIEKHTFVDGLSDIDSLVILNDTTLVNKSPKTVQKIFMTKLKAALPKGTKVDAGNLAVNISYKDKMQIQLIPAVRQDKQSIKIPSYDGTQWSKIRPKEFTQKLTKSNKQMGGKLVPTIKIIKSINSDSPKNRQLSGYHIESLAIKAFKGYKGEKMPKKMLEHFFANAKTTVRVPMSDSTGQSIQVDGYLGKSNSEKRKAIGYHLDIISRKIASANNASSLPAWKEIVE